MSHRVSPTPLPPPPTLPKRRDFVGTRKNFYPLSRQIYGQGSGRVNLEQRKSEVAPSLNKWKFDSMGDVPFRGKEKYRQPRVCKSFGDCDLDDVLGMFRTP